MATLPRPSTKSAFHRPALDADFDSGINSSAAWTESNKPSIDLLRSTRRYVSESNAQHASLSDEELDEGELILGDDDAQPARALYAFEGKPEFRELDVEAGDEIDVLKADERKPAKLGLLPQSYYTIDHSPNGKQYPRQKEPSGDSITPRGSRRSISPPLIPQNTGEWIATFPSFRHSLLGGKSLNRFSTFVTSGAEEFVLKGSTVLPEADFTTPPSNQGHSREDTAATIDEEEQQRRGRQEADRHFVSAGPSWKEKVPPFRVLVHSPSKLASLLSGAYTVYNITSFFHSQEAPEDEDEERLTDEHEPDDPIANVTVQRRFSHFVVLHTALTRRLPGIALPPLPEKQYAGRFSDDFVEARRGDLERYINKIVRHPVARYAEILTFFLSCESDAEWKRRLPEHLSMPPAGPAFYARVYHPAFNLDKEDIADAADLFENHTRAVGKSVQSLRSIFSKVREARIEMSKAERLLSYSLLSLITSKPLSSSSTGFRTKTEPWCWRSNCHECLKLTKAIQKTSDTLQSVADIYNDHARRTQLATHESMKTTAHPSSIYEGVITTHRATVSRYNEAANGPNPDDDVANRCETVLNITMAEMDTYHTQKQEDFRKLTTEHIDGEIQAYEQILTRLYLARRTFDSPAFDELSTSPRKSSIYERDLANPQAKLNPKPLTQPCPHVFDSTPMRPVSVALQEGVNLLLSSTGRGSVFSKFW
ncbi:hypothetical protein FA13DRAFT_1753432 [Coprinellus micaceus]|uniref:PX domain-containing protein n=1 Tax=Coprinellus micaceus TaxID=71717 RepID=A0A4Y7TNF0_COPMI|nr:hypothetical protein FA13DRAFT_1753432 [Coprinellus micaceus]